MDQTLWFLIGLGIGLLLDLPLVRYLILPLQKKVEDLELTLEADSLQKMDRILALEQELRETQKKSLDYQMELARAQDQLMWRLQ